MIRLSSSVGRGASNRTHDVATVQAALSQIADTPRGGSAKLWTRAVDGRASPELDAVIARLQERERIGATHRIDPPGPTLSAIDRALPPAWRGLTGIEGTAAVACTACTGQDADHGARLLRERTLLPRDAADALADLARAVFRATGLVLRADGHGLDGRGRLVQALALADTLWVTAGGRLEPRAPFGEGRRVVDTLHRLTPGGAIEWSRDPLPTVSAPPGPAQRLGTGSAPGHSALDGVLLAVRTRASLVSGIVPTKPADPTRLSRLRLQPTGDPVADRLLDAVVDALSDQEAGQ